MIQIFLTILFSSVKFAMTFPMAVMKFQFDFLETVLWTNVGGIIGVYFFAYLSEKLIAWWNRTFKKNPRTNLEQQAAEKKIFTRRTRRIIYIKQRYGLIGIAAATPFLLSIPVGTFLVIRYYRTQKTRFLYLIASNLVWSAIYTSFYVFLDGILFT